MSVSKIKIAYFIDAYSPGAGTENQLRGLLQYLDSNRFEAHLITLRDEIASEHRKEIPWPVRSLGVKRLMGLSAIVKFVGLVRYLRREKYDIVSTYFDDTNLFVIPAAFLAGVKCRIVNRRNMGYRGQWRSHSLSLKLSVVNKLANYFLTNSFAIKEQIIRTEHFPEERIKVIYNGLFENPGVVSEIISRADLGFPENTPMVGIVANLRPVKRVDRFIEMAAMVLTEVPGARFLVLGQGQLLPDLKLQAESLGIAGKVNFLGTVRNVRAHLNTFDVAVLTSESEGLSNSLIEYAAAGVPAVAFDTGGNKEVIKDGVSGYVVPNGDVRKMADKVIEILSDRDKRARFATAGEKIVKTVFAPEKVMAETMALYETIADIGNGD